MQPALEVVCRAWENKNNQERKIDWMKAGCLFITGLIEYGSGFRDLSKKVKQGMDQSIYIHDLFKNFCGEVAEHNGVKIQNVIDAKLYATLEECPICMDAVANTETGCSPVAHKACEQCWLRLRNNNHTSQQAGILSCPLCRQRVQKLKVIHRE